MYEQRVDCIDAVVYASQLIQGAVAKGVPQESVLMYMMNESGNIAEAVSCEQEIHGIYIIR